MNTRPLTAEELLDEIKNIRNGMLRRSEMLKVDSAGQEQWRSEYDYVIMNLSTVLNLKKEEQ